MWKAYTYSLVFIFEGLGATPLQGMGEDRGITAAGGIILKGATPLGSFSQFKSLENCHSLQGFVTGRFINSTAEHAQRQ